MSGLLESHPFVAQRVPGDLRLVAVTDEGLGNTSWVLDLGGHAVVVDPERDPAPYEAIADRLGAEIAYTADTHLHADFITGSPELAASGAAALASEAGDLRWDHHGLGAGDGVVLGDWQLRALATPGHTPEHLAFLLEGPAGPRAVFTGGSLLVGAVARTDLTDPADTEGLTRALWRSIQSEILSLPDHVLVLPTHGAGSFCSAAGGAQRWSTVGDERRANPLFSAADEDSFVHQVLAGLGSYPPYFLRLREVNRLGPAVLGALPALRRLSAEEVGAHRQRGALIVDVRSFTSFSAGHVAGSLANTLRPQFGSWLGWIVPDLATPLLFVADDHTDRREVVRQCLNLGYENLIGELAGGIAAWSAAGGEVATNPVVDPGQVGRRAVLDIRLRKEFDGGHIPGAAHVELGDLSDSLADLPAGPLVVMCGHGERAATAASILEAAGRDDVAVLAGGPGDWVAATGEPLVVE